MAKTIELAFVMAGKVAPGFMAASKAVTAQLTAVEKKTKDIQTAAEKRASINSWKAFTASVKGARAAVAGLGSEIAGTFRIAAGFLAGNGLLTGAVYGIAKSSAETADSVIKNAQMIGTSAQAYTELAYAADMANVSEQEFIAATVKLNKTAKSALGGNKAADDVFFRAGVELRNANGEVKNAQQLYSELADVFAAMPEGPQKTALATELFGRSGAKLLPLLNSAAAGFEAMAKEAAEVGLIITDEDYRNAEAFNDSFSKINKAVKGLTLTIGKELWPVLTGLHLDVAAWVTEQRVWLAEKMPGWVADFKAEIPALKEQVKALLAEGKEWVVWINDMAQSFGGWIPLVKSLVEYWIYWRGIKIGLAFYDTAKAVRGLGKSFLELQYHGTSVKGVLKTFGGGLKKFGGGVKTFTVETAAELKRWGGTFRMAFLALKDYADDGLKALVAFGKGAGSKAAAGARAFARAMWAGTVATGKFAAALVVQGAAALASFAAAAGAGIVAALSAIGAGFVAAATAAWGFTAAVLANPITWIVAGVVALGAGIVMLIKHWDDVVAAMKAAWGWIEGIFIEGWNALAGWIQEPLESLVQYITDFDIVSAATNLMTRFGEGLLSAWNAIKGGIASAVTDWIPGGSHLMEGAAAAASGVSAAAGWVGGKLSAISPFANGGLVTAPQVGLVGEAGPEVIVPLNRPSRAGELMDSAARMLGRSGGGNAGRSFVFAPTVTVQAGDGSAAAELRREMERLMRDFVDMVDRRIDQREHARRRLAYR